MNTTELIEIARELGAHHYLDTFEKECICFVTEELQQFAQRIEQPNKQRIAELTDRANKIADNLEQAEKRLSEIAFKACANLDTKDTQIAQLREALQLAKVMMQANDLYLPKTLDVIDKALEESQ